MAGKTVSQRLEDLTARVSDHIPQAEVRLDLCERGLYALVEDVRALEALPQQVADLKERVKQLEAVESQSIRHDERLKAMEKAAEKGSDRLWQLVPILVSAVGVVIALTALFVRK